MFLFVVAFLVLVVILFGAFTVTRKVLSQRREEFKARNGISSPIIAFFHPYCNAGGGGERVLWCAVRAVQSKYPNFHIAVYTGDAVPSEKILKEAKERFNVDVISRITFVRLKKRKWVEASCYPFFTLLGQSLGSVVLGFEALWNLTPDVYVDTMGYAFTYPIFRHLAQCQVGCYVHYPTISSDMLGKVSKRSAAFNNNSFIARSAVLTFLKITYYKLFAKLYGWVGRQAHCVMVNSSWTEGHINDIWDIPWRTNKVYPPCDVQEFLAIERHSPSQESHRAEPVGIIAVAQFRPEKDHPLMLRSFFQFVNNLREEDKDRVKLLLVGSCRHAEDYQRVDDYRKLSKHLAIDDRVEFHINVSFAELKKLMSESLIGLHAMFNEHFGIGVVECMAAGLLMVAHKSGGPMMDIVMEHTGFLAADEDEYSDVFHRILKMNAKERERMQQSARDSVIRFSDANFEENFLRAVSPLFRNTNS